MTRARLNGGFCNRSVSITIYGAVNIRHSLLALSALALPAAASRNMACRSPPPPPPQPCACRAPASPSRGWRRRRPGAAAMGPAAADRAAKRAPALEPIDLPPAIEQGVDMIYIDEELVPRAVQDNGR